MLSEIKQVPGTEKYPYACIIIIEGIYRTDRICDSEKALLIENFIMGQTDIKKVRLHLAKFCIDVHPINNGGKL